jgi:hypothetical protein
MSRALLVCVVVIGAAACAATTTSSHVGTLRELAGTWQGRFALRLANAAATMEIKEDGAYAGALHTEAGERPFNGAIVRLPTGRLRYQGTHGNGIVLLTPGGTTTTLRFVPDGGGGGGSFTRVQ